jgi:hypothetical protein
MSDDEANDVQRVVLDLLETGVGQAEDNSKDRSGDVSQHWCPEEREGPILTVADDGVEIVPELVALH